MNSFELTIKEGAISTNLETLKEELAVIAAQYEGMVVSEDTVPDAKKDLADLRKVVKEIEDRRKTVKREWEKPYKDFEAEVKAALEIINTPIELIDKQVKDFEKKKKEEKEQHIKDLYAENIQGYEEYLPFTAIFNEKWLNVSVKDQEIIFDINGAVTKVKADLEAIKALNSEFEEEITKVYKASGNQLSMAIQRNTQLISAKQIAKEKAEREAQEKIEAERKAREEAERKAAEAEKALEEVKEESKEELEEPLPFDVEKATFTVYGADILTVRLFLEDNNIEYQEV